MESSSFQKIGKPRSTSKDLLKALSLNIISNFLLYVGHLIIARRLPRADYATFTVVISFVSLAALFADIGSTSHFVRKFAEAETLALEGKADERGKLLGSILGLRIGLAVLVSVAVMLLIPLLGYAPTTQHLILIVLTILFISSRLPIVRSVGEAFLRGHRKYHVVALFAAIDGLVFAGILFFYSGKILDLESAIWIYSFCHIPGFLLLIGFIYRHAKSAGFHLSFSFASIRSILHEGLPLIYSTIFITIYNYADPLLLDKLSTPQQVSAFGAGLRVLSAMIFFPLVFSSIIGPLVTQAVIKGEFTRIRSIIDRALRLLLLFSVLVALSISSAPTVMIHLLFGSDKYLDAAPIVMVFSWMFIPMCFGTFMTEVAIAEGKHWLSAVYMGALMIFAVSFNFLLIPMYGGLGSAIAKLLAVILGASILLSLSKVLDVLDRGLFIRFVVKIIIAVLLTCLLRYFLIRLNINEVIIAATVCSSFLILSFLSRALSLSEISSVVTSIVNRKGG